MEEQLDPITGLPIKRFDVSVLNANKLTSTGGGKGSVFHGTDEFDSQLDFGLMVGLDRNTTRARNQTGMQEFGNFLGAATGQIIGGGLESTGYLAEILNPFSSIMNNADEEYGNIISEFGKGISKATNEEYKVYQEDSNNIWDSEFWAANGASLASSLSLLIPARAGVAILGKAAKMTKMGKMAARAAKIKPGGKMANLLMGSKGLSAAVISRHMESSMEASQVFESTYKRAITKGLSEEQAKQKAGTAASSTYKTNWLALATDIPQYLMLFRGISGSVSKGMKEFGKDLGKTMVSEGMEEGFQYIVGKESEERQFNPKDEMGERLYEYLNDDEFKHSVILGAAGGSIFTAGGKAMQKTLTTIAERNNRIHSLVDNGEVIQAAVEQGTQFAEQTSEMNLEQRQSTLDMAREDLNDPELTEEDRAIVQDRVESLEQYETLLETSETKEEADVKLRLHEIQKTAQRELEKANKKKSGILSKISRAFSFAKKVKNPDESIKKVELKAKKEAIETIEPKNDTEKKIKKEQLAEINEGLKDLKEAIIVSTADDVAIKQAVKEEVQAEFQNEVANETLDELNSENKEDKLNQIRKDKIYKQVSNMSIAELAIKSKGKSEEALAAQDRITEEANKETDENISGKNILDAYRKNNQSSIDKFKDMPFTLLYKLGKTHQELMDEHVNKEEILSGLTGETPSKESKTTEEVVEDDLNSLGDDALSALFNEAPEKKVVEQQVKEQVIQEKKEEIEEVEIINKPIDNGIEFKENAEFLMTADKAVYNLKTVKGVAGIYVDGGNGKRGFIAIADIEKEGYKTDNLSEVDPTKSHLLYDLNGNTIEHKNVKEWNLDVDFMNKLHTLDLKNIDVVLRYAKNNKYNERYANSRDFVIEAVITDSNGDHVIGVMKSDKNGKDQALRELREDMWKDKTLTKTVRVKKVNGGQFHNLKNPKVINDLNTVKPDNIPLIVGVAVSADGGSYMHINLEKLDEDKKNFILENDMPKETKLKDGSVYFVTRNLAGDLVWAQAFTHSVKQAGLQEELLSALNKYDNIGSRRVIVAKMGSDKYIPDVNGNLENKFGGKRLFKKGVDGKITNVKTDNRNNHEKFLVPGAILAIPNNSEKATSGKLDGYKLIFKVLEKNENGFLVELLDENLNTLKETKTITEISDEHGKENIFVHYAYNYFEHNGLRDRPSQINKQNINTGNYNDVIVKERVFSRLNPKQNFVNASIALDMNYKEETKQPTKSESIVPTQQVGANASDRNKNESVADYVDRLEQQGIITNIDGKSFFEANSRLAVIINVNGVKLPFYQSTQGTDGKKSGNWYPMFGFTGNWLIKGRIKEMKNGYGIKSIQNMQSFLNENIPEKDSLYSNLVPKRIKDTDTSIRTRNSQFTSEAFNYNSKLSFNVEEGYKIIAQELGYSVEEARSKDLDSDTGLFEFASKNVLNKLRALESNSNKPQATEQKPTKLKASEKNNYTNQLMDTLLEARKTGKSLEQAEAIYKYELEKLEDAYKDGSSYEFDPVTVEEWDTFLKGGIFSNPENSRDYSNHEFTGFENFGIDNKPKTTEQSTEQVQENYDSFDISNLVRPDGSLGTQGFTSEQMLDLINYVSDLMGIVLPKHDVNKKGSELKQLIDYLKNNEQAKNLILEYVKSDPVKLNTLPDGSYHLKDGNHRANLLNLIGVKELPIVNDNTNESNKITKKSTSSNNVESTEQVQEKDINHYGDEFLKYLGNHLNNTAVVSLNVDSIPNWTIGLSGNSKIKIKDVINYLVSQDKIKLENIFDGVYVSFSENTPQISQEELIQAQAENIFTSDVNIGSDGYTLKRSMEAIVENLKAGNPDIGSEVIHKGKAYEVVKVNKVTFGVIDEKGKKKNLKKELVTLKQSTNERQEIQPETKSQDREDVEQSTGEEVQQEKQEAELTARERHALRNANKNLEQGKTNVIAEHVAKLKDNEIESIERVKEENETIEEFVQKEVKKVNEKKSNLRGSVKKIINRIAKAVTNFIVGFAILSNLSFINADLFTNDYYSQHDKIVQSSNVQNWGEHKLNLEATNKLTNLQIIQDFHTGDTSQYLVVDKVNARMHLYRGNELVDSFEIGTGKIKGDEQTKTIVRNGKVRWNEGNLQTGAGKYTVIEESRYFGEPMFTLKNDLGIQVASAIHVAPSRRNKYFNNNNIEDNRMSYGCVNGKCSDMRKLSKEHKISGGENVYILPDNPNNFFQIKDKQLQFISSNAKVNRTYKQAKTINDLYFEISPEVLTESTYDFVNHIISNKVDLMEDLNLSDTEFNDLTKIAFGIFGQESSFNTISGPRSAYGNARDLVGIALKKDVSSGSTQLRYSNIKKHQDKLTKYGLNSNKDLLDLNKSSIATMFMLSDLYKNEVPIRMREDINILIPLLYNNKTIAKKYIKGDYNGKVFIYEYVDNVNAFSRKLKLFGSFAKENHGNRLNTPEAKYSLKEKGKYEKWNKSEELEWLKDKLPNVPVHVLSDLKTVIKNAPDAYGAFYQSAIYLMNNAKRGTAYHEAFHAVFTTMLNENQQKDILRQAYAKFGKSLGITKAEFEADLKRGNFEDTKYSIGKGRNINFKLKVVDALENPKFQGKYRASKADSFFNRLSKVGVPKDQLEALKTYLKDNNIDEISKEDLIDKIIQDLSFDVSINNSIEADEFMNVTEDYSANTGKTVYNVTDMLDGNFSKNFNTKKEAEDYVKNNKTSFYGNVSLKQYQNNPNYEYQELTINTPFDTVADGHFATSDKSGASTIGHVRGYRNKVDNSYIVIEFQSDIFQKNKDSEILTKKTGIYDKGQLVMYSNKKLDEQDYKRDGYELKPSDENQNNFLQFLNKDQRWVRFFTQAIIQGAAKQGRSKVLFPNGTTAAKVEGHDTIQDELEDSRKNAAELKEYISTIENREESIYDKYQNRFIYDSVNDTYFNSMKQSVTIKELLTMANRDLKKSLDSIKHYETAGLEQLAPIQAFYENRVGNILKKDFKAKNVKDQYGYGWREVVIDNKVKSKVDTLKLSGEDSYYKKQRPVTRLEEMLANEFQSFVMNNGKSLGLGAKIKKFFKRTINTLKSLIDNKLTIDELYYRVNDGFYRNTKPAKVEQSNPKYLEVPGFTPTEQEESVETISNLLVEALIDHSKSTGKTGRGLMKTLLGSRNKSVLTGEELSYSLPNKLYRHIDKMREDGTLTKAKEDQIYKIIDNLSVKGAGDMYYNTELTLLALRSLARVGMIHNEKGTFLTSGIGLVESQIINRNSEHDEVMNANEDGREAYQRNSKEISALEFMDNELMMKLYNIPQRNNKGDIVNDFVGLMKTRSPQWSYKQIQRAAGNSIDTNDMMKKLTASNIPEMQDVLNLIREDSDLKTSLFLIAQRVQPRFVTIIEDGKKTSTINSNLNSLNNNISAEYVAAIFQNPKLYSPSGVNFKQGKIIKAYYTDALEAKGNPDFTSKSHKLFTELGLNISIDYLNRLGTKELEKYMFSKKGSIGKFIDNLAAGKDPIAEGNLDSIKYLAKTLSKFYPQQTQDAHRNSSGSKVFEWLQSSFMGRLINKFNNKDYYEAEMRKYRTDPTFAKLPIFQEIKKAYKIGAKPFKFVMLSELKQKGKLQGIEYKDMNEKDVYTVGLNWYQNAQGRETNFKAIFPLPVHSDAPSMTGLEITVSRHARMDEKYSSDGKGFVDKLFDVAHSEIIRVFDDSLDDIKSVRKNKKFLLFDVLNNHMEKIKLMHEAGDVAGLKMLLVGANKKPGVLLKDAKNRIELEKQKMLELGIVSEKNGVYKFENNIANGKSGKEFESFMAEYVINYMVHYAQIATLFNGDVSFYKHIGDFYKRAKQVYSPGIYQDVNAKYTDPDKKEHGVRKYYNNKILDTVMHVDPKFNAKVLKMVGVDSPAYAEWDISTDELKEKNASDKTDAQSFIDLFRMREVMIGLKRWDDTMQSYYDDLMEGDFNLTKMSGILKPFYFSHHKIGNRVVPMQNKNSEMVILPVFAKKNSPFYNPKYKEMLEEMGYTFDEEGNNITDMESFEKNRESGIHTDQFSFDTAIKVGQDKSKKGGIKTAPNVAFNNEDWRLQMETPEHHVNSKVVFATQVRKHMMNNIDKEGTYILNGKEVTGADLLKKYNDAIIGNIEDDFEKLKKTLNKDNFKGLVDMMKEEILSRNLGDEYLDSLEIITDENGELTTKLPIWHPLHLYRMEALLNSIVTNRVVSKKIKRGVTLANISAFGYEREPKVIFNDRGGIDYFEAYMPVYDTALMSKEFLDDNGYIDVAKVEAYNPKLLEGMVWRIPNEDKYSTTRIKIIGFLPQEINGIVLPAEITKLAGLDYDIDKMYGFMYSDKNKELSAEDVRNNNILDIMTAIMTDSKTAESILYPGSYNDIVNTNKIIRIKEARALGMKNKNGELVTTIKEIEAVAKPILSPSYHAEIANRMLVGKSLIGIFANSAVGHAVFQHIENLGLMDFVYFNGKKLSKLNKLKDTNGNLISKNHAQAVAAVVDNGNDPQMGYSNINSYTVDVATMLTQLGLPWKTIQLFLSQPLMRKFVNQHLRGGGNSQSEMAVLNDPFFVNVFNSNFSNFFKRPTTLQGIAKGKILPNMIFDVTDRQLENSIATEDYGFQIKVLVSFLQYKKMSNQYSNLVQATKLAENGLGPTDSHSLQKIDYVDPSGSTNYNNLTGVSNLFKSDLYFQKLNNILPEGRDMLIKAADLPDTNKGNFKKLRDYFKAFKSNNILSIAEIDFLNKNYLDYLSSESLPYSQDLIDNLPERLRQYTEIYTESDYAPFTNRLRVELESSKQRSFIVYSGVTGQDKVVQNQIKNAWKRMLVEGDVMEKQLANDLIQYAFMQSGFRMSPNSFGNLIPSSYFYTKTDFTKKLKSDIESAIQETTGIHDFIDLFIQNHFRSLEYIPKVDTESKKVSLKEGVLIVKDSPNYAQVGEFGTTYMKYLKHYNEITFDLELYMKISAVEGKMGEIGATYMKIEEKGIYKKRNVSKNEYTTGKMMTEWKNDSGSKRELDVGGVVSPFNPLPETNLESEQDNVTFDVFLEDITEQEISEVVSQTDAYLADFFFYGEKGKLSSVSYRRFGDKNNISSGSKTRYVQNNGEHVDVLAKTISDELDIEFTPQEIIDFTDEYKSKEDFQNKMRVRYLDNNFGDTYNLISKKGTSVRDEVKNDLLFPSEQNNLTSVKNLFSVTPKQAVDKKAKSKAKISTQYIGFAEGISGSSTALYAKQAGEYANTGNYGSDDVIFASVGGKRGDVEARKVKQTKTIKEVIKAIEAGATVLLDNKAYVESNNYNEGEKRMMKNLDAKGYEYSEIKVDGHLIGVWKRGEVKDKKLTKLGVKNIPNTNLSIEQSNKFIDILQPVIENQAYVENKAKTANKMFSFGLRWAKVNSDGNAKFNSEQSGVFGKIPNRVKINQKEDRAYGYFSTDQNNNELVGMDNLKPIINFIESKLKIDMSDYDAMLGNIYEENSFIHQHRDTTESKTAENYPVIVINLGANGHLEYDEKPSNYASYKKTGQLDLKNGGIYAFGVNGKNRFKFHHRIGQGLESNTETKPITLPDGTTLENYRITLTFRRVQDITKNIPNTPKTISLNQTPEQGDLFGGFNSAVDEKLQEQLNNGKIKKKDC